jgi:hypothetical protein
MARPDCERVEFRAQRIARDRPGGRTNGPDAEASGPFAVAA